MYRRVHKNNINQTKRINSNTIKNEMYICMIKERMSEKDENDLCVEFDDELHVYVNSDTENENEKDFDGVIDYESEEETNELPLTPALVTKPYSSLHSLTSILDDVPSSPDFSFHNSEESDLESEGDSNMHVDTIQNQITSKTDENENAVTDDHDVCVNIETNESNDLKDNGGKFEYQQSLKEYVNQCLFIRTNRIGHRVGFKPTLPKNTDFVQCWNCNDWIPPYISPPCLPLCSQTHMNSKYVYEKLIGFFCSFECIKKFIFQTMNTRQREKYMRSLLQFRRTFYPELNNKAIPMLPSRTCMSLYGGPIKPEDYYSKIDKINLPPLPEDINFTLNARKTSA